MPGLWEKHFVDGTIEKGFDDAIQEGKASWTKGRLHDIQFVKIWHNDRASRLEVPSTEWHQFDRLVAPIAFGQHQPQRTHRVVQALITPLHIGMELCSAGRPNLFGVFTSDKRPPTSKIEHRITEVDVGKWLTMIMDLRHDTTVIIFTRRGKMNE